MKKILLGVGALAFSAVAAVAGNNKIINTYFYKDVQGNPQAVQVSFTCTPNSVGCLGTSGASLGKQLYTAADFRTPLRH